ncbi:MULTISPECIES: Gp37 family protein [Pseudovibrio]|uniref:Gp37 family protein n=1 Tax=Stappiaceae TaxID=2821832 RepID=UPI00236715FF|nr:MULTISPECIES: Gp37 family protein [Pseudovibrio]MDD7908636.1 Gp37 family protein [Pseudovibrio exalbescens]MDX5595316.1 Gp37 family protein [Pseudovibrio sp. SPO723]
MTLIERLQNQIVERLKLYLPSVAHVDGFPSKPEEFDLANFQMAALVHYGGSRYSSDNGLNNATQSRQMRFVVALSFTSLNGEHGAYVCLERCRAALQNYPLAGSTPLMMEREDLVDQAPGLWRWQIEVSCLVRSVSEHQGPQRPVPSIPRQED